MKLCRSCLKGFWFTGRYSFGKPFGVVVRRRQRNLNKNPWPICMVGLFSDKPIKKLDPRGKFHTFVLFS